MCERVRVCVHACACLCVYLRVRVCACACCACLRVCVCMRACVCCACVCVLCVCAVRARVCWRVRVCVCVLCLRQAAWCHSWRAQPPETSYTPARRVAHTGLQTHEMIGCFSSTDDLTVYVQSLLKYRLQRVHESREPSFCLFADSCSSAKKR